MPMGRPTKFTKAVADEICERLADGETLKAICEDEHMPHRKNVAVWIVHDLDFRDRVAGAREAGSHIIVDETREIADDGRNDWMETRGQDGEAKGWKINGEAVQRSKLRIEQRWREAEAILPKVYGRKTQVEHSGHIALVNAEDEELLTELMELVASGRLKLPGGVQLVEDFATEDTSTLAEDDFSDIA